MKITQKQLIMNGLDKYVFNMKIYIKKLNPKQKKIHNKTKYNK